MGHEKGRECNHVEVVLPFLKLFLGFAWRLLSLALNHPTLIRLCQKQRQGRMLLVVQTRYWLEDMFCCWFHRSQCHVHLLRPYQDAGICIVNLKVYINIFRNGYNLFCTELLPKLQCLKSQTRIKECGKLWNKLSKDQKEEYHTRFIEKKTIYEKKLKAFLDVSSNTVTECCCWSTEIYNNT